MQVNYRILLIIALFSLFAISLLPARGNRENPAPDEIPDTVPYIQVIGVVRLVGNQPFPELVITGEEHQWYIAVKEDRDKLFDLQHRTVTVEAEETLIERRFANGHLAGIRRELINIKIISDE